MCGEREKEGAGEKAIAKFALISKAARRNSVLESGNAPGSTLLFQPQSLPLLGGRHLVEMLGQVSFESIFGRFLSVLTEDDQKPTKNRLRVDRLRGVRCGVCSLKGRGSVAESIVSTPGSFLQTPI